MRSLLLAGAISIGAFALPASATTVNFNFLSESLPVATGQFTYADGASGVLGYGDLTSFTLTIGAVSTFTLADVQALTDFVWFAYDTAGNSFVANSSGSCGFAGCAFFPTLSATSNDGASGFFFSSIEAGIFQDFTAGAAGSFDSIALIPVPEPGTLALLGAGLLGLGAIRRRATRAG